MSILSAIPTILGAATKPLGMIIGNRSNRERYAANENAEAQKQHAAEFTAYRENRNGFDSLVDGLNRLVRPTLVYTTLWLFSMAVWDTARFGEIMLAFSVVPELMWQLMFIIFGFYLTSRMIERVNIDRVRVKKKEVEKILETNKEIKKLRAERLSEENAIDGADETIIEVEGLPWLDNESVKTWKEKSR